VSKTTVPPKTALEVWLRAGGRCEYRGCNIPLWKDELTLAKMNRAYLAHIIADSPGGPRGDPILSPKLKADPANIMLLCDTHHRLVDKGDVNGHTVELLLELKREHEDRIERQTAIQTERRTEILLFGTKIKDRSGQVNYDEAREAVLPERYPMSESGIRIDLATLDLNENDPEYWPLVGKQVERVLARHLGQGLGPTGKPINHLSVFALAPIPALMSFGKILGDTIPADVYQRHRTAKHWSWRPLEDEGFNYTLLIPDPAEHKSSVVAVNLSLSGIIHPTEIERAMKNRAPMYTITISQPRRDFLQSKEQLELFRSEWFKLIAQVRSDFGEDCIIHLFPAIPVAIAVEIGRSLLPKSDPTMIVYDQDKEHGGFQAVLTL
jgi:hypothetical protein